MSNKRTPQEQAIQVRRSKPCPECEGAGWIENYWDGETCWRCKGTGYVEAR